MKNRNLLLKKLFAMLLSAAMIITYMPGAYFAYAGTDDDQTVVEQPADGSVEESVEQPSEPEVEPEEETEVVEEPAAVEESSGDESTEEPPAEQVTDPESVVEESVEEQSPVQETIPGDGQQSPAPLKGITSGVPVVDSAEENPAVEEETNDENNELTENTDPEEGEGTEPTNSDVIDSGTCGAYLTWTLTGTEDGMVLTISGTGEMNSFYEQTDAPWYEYWTDIESIVITEGVTSIGAFAFNNCSLAESITIPNSLNRIYSFAFNGCAFKKVYISDLKCYLSIPFGHYNESNPTEKGADLYLGGSLVEDLVIPDGITNIPHYSFWGCTSIKSVTIPEGVTTINQYAFVECSNLKNISFPSSLSEICSCAFSGCNSIEKLFISDVASYLSITYESGGNIYPLTYYGADLYINNVKADTIIIPDTITHIGANTLMGSSVKTVIIPEGIKSIGSGAFAHCKNLSSITLPNSLKVIGSGAFASCKNLSSITLPNSLKVIDDTAFEGCINLPSINIPMGVESIGWAAFEGCIGLQTIYIPDSVTSIGEYAFDGLNGREGVNGTFYVKKASYAEQYLVEKGKNIEYYCFGNHGWNEEYTVDKEATCTEEGSESIHCSVCGEIQEGSARAIDKKPHAYGDWTTTKEPTCTEDGSREKVCVCCGDTETEVITALGHTPSDPVREDELAATCDKEGSYDEAVYCSVCKEEMSREKKTIAALGHKWNEDYTIDKEPTCIEEGSKSIHCSRCNAIDESTIEVHPKVDHTYGSWVTDKAATCTAAGSKSRTCSVCGDKVSETIAAVGHSWNEDFTVDKKATCTSEGSKSKHCANCSEKSEVTAIAATGHSWNSSFTVDKKATCTAQGSKSKHCATCGAKSEVAAIAATGHSWDAGTVTTKATCTTAGVKTFTCKTCKTKKTSSIAATGHSWNSSYTVDTKATCTKTGSKSIHCSKCNTKKSGSAKTIAKIAHKFSAWKTTKAATEVATGTQSHKCSACGKTETKTIAMLAPTLPAVTISAPKAAKKAVTVKWKKVSKANQKKIGSIQIQYSTDKNFKTGVKTVSASKKGKSKKIKGLTSKTTYYVRIRAYISSGGKVHVSKWSTVKAVKAK